MAAISLLCVYIQDNWDGKEALVCFKPRFIIIFSKLKCTESSSTFNVKMAVCERKGVHTAGFVLLDLLLINMILAIETVLFWSNGFENKEKLPKALETFITRKPRFVWHILSEKGVYTAKIGIIIRKVCYLHKRRELTGGGFSNFVLTSNEYLPWPLFPQFYTPMTLKGITGLSIHINT